MKVTRKNKNSDNKVFVWGSWYSNVSNMGFLIFWMLRLREPVILGNRSGRNLSHLLFHASA